MKQTLTKRKVEIDSSTTVVGLFWWLSGEEDLGQEDPLEKEMATHSSILTWETMDRGAWELQSIGSERDTTELLSKHMSIKNTGASKVTQW